MVILVAVLQSSSLQLAEHRSDPAVKTRHSGHTSINKQAGAVYLLPWVLMSAGDVESQALVHLFVVYGWTEHNQAWIRSSPN